MSRVRSRYNVEDTFTNGLAIQDSLDPRRVGYLLWATASDGNRVLTITSDEGTVCFKDTTIAVDEPGGVAVVDPLPWTDNGDIVYYTGVLPARLAAGSAGQVLTVNGSGVPSWQSPTDPLNTLIDEGDIIVRDAIGPTNLAVGTEGQVLTVVSGIPGWQTAATNVMLDTITDAGDLVYGTGAAAVDRLGIGSAGQVLTVSGGGLPSWATPSADVPLSTIAAGGDLIYGSGMGAVSNLSIGSAGQVLTVSGGVPSWQPNAVNVLGTDGDVLYYNGGYQALGVGSAGQVLTISGGLPSWQTPSADVPLSTIGATGDLIYGSAVGAVSALSVGSSGAVLRSNGTIPTWDKGEFVFGSSAVLDTGVAIPESMSGLVYRGPTSNITHPGSTVLGAIPDNVIRVTTTSGADYTMQTQTASWFIANAFSYTGGGQGDVFYFSVANTSSYTLSLQANTGVTLYYYGKTATQPSLEIPPQSSRRFFCERWTGTTVNIYQCDENAVNAATTLGDTLYYDGSVYQALGIGSAGQVLTVSGGVPSWQTPSADVPLSTIAAAGDLIYGSDAGVVSNLGIGSAGQVLMVNGTGTAPEWQTSVDIPLSTIQANGDLIVGTGLGTVGRIAAGANGYVLTMGPTGTPGWAVASGSLPSGTKGDLLWYNGASWTTITHPAQKGAPLVSGDSLTPAWQTDALSLGTASVASGLYSVAIGIGSPGIDPPQATNTDSLAIGRNATASGSASVCIGGGTSSGAGSVAFGGGTATAQGSVAIGTSSLSEGTGSVAIGGSGSVDRSHAAADNSIAIGIDTQAHGVDSVAIGRGAVCTSDYGVALGSGASLGPPLQSKFALGPDQFIDTNTFTPNRRLKIRIGTDEYWVGMQTV